MVASKIHESQPIETKTKARVFFIQVSAFLLFKVNRKDTITSFLDAILVSIGNCEQVFAHCKTNRQKIVDCKKSFPQLF